MSCVLHAYMHEREMREADTWEILHVGAATWSSLLFFYKTFFRLGRYCYFFVRKYSFFSFFLTSTQHFVSSWLPNTI